MPLIPYQLSLLGDDSQTTRVFRVGGLVSSAKAAMRRALAAVTPPLSREQLVDRMNALAKRAGVKITSDKSRTLSLATLEKWLSTNDHDHFPSIEALEIFMIAVDSAEPLSVLADMHGYRLISHEESKILDYGKATLAAKKAGKTAKRLEEEIGNVRA